MNCSIKKCRLVVSLFFVLWLGGSLLGSAIAADTSIEHPFFDSESFRGVVFEALDELEKGLQSKKNLSSVVTNLKARHGNKIKIFPFLDSPERSLVYLEMKKEKVILGRLEKEVDSIYSEPSFPVKWGLFFPKLFEELLLKDNELFLQIVKDENFLRHWIPDLSKKQRKKDLNGLIPYLFKIKKPKRHYNLAAVTGEDRFFPDITEHDKELYFLHKPLLHYFEKQPDRVLYFSKVDDPEVLKVLPELLVQYYADEDRRDFFIQAFKVRHQSERRAFFDDATFMKSLKSILDAVSQKYDFSNIPGKYLTRLIIQIQRFLKSNGYYNVESLALAPDWFKVALAERFLMAKTTAFFRDWREMKYLNKWFEDLELRCQKENRPIKIKVFGCSTGQEVLSYAFEMLEKGITDFRILASDIDHGVLLEAKGMRYGGDKFLSLPDYLKEHLLENYFEEDEKGVQVVKYKKFLLERVKFMIQDISKPLGNIDDSEFAPPYDLISVKNVMLYLDPKAVHQSVPYLGSLLAPKGVLIVRDKRYRAARFVPSLLKNYMGITDFQVIKTPDDSLNEGDALNLLELFADPLPPSALFYFYDFAKRNDYSILKNRCVELSLRASQRDFPSQKVLFEDAMQKRDVDQALSILKNITYIEPFQFIEFFKPFQQAFPRNSLSSSVLAGKSVSIFKKIQEVKSNEEMGLFFSQNLDQMVYDPKTPDELVLLVAHALLARDQGLFSGVIPSPDYRWARRGVDILRKKIVKADSSNIVCEHYGRLLEKYFNLHKGLSDQYKHEMLLPLLERVTAFERDKFSIKGRIAISKLLTVEAGIEKDPKQKETLFRQVLTFCDAEEFELDLLLDWWFAQYYLVRGNAYYQLSRMLGRKKSFEKRKLLERAFKMFDLALSTQSVYGHRALHFKSKVQREMVALDL